MGDSFTTGELERYARHIIMREIGGPGQRRLRGAKVLVVGAGGLGSPALIYLAAAGVGTIGIVDDDVVSLSNLQRQVIHTTRRVGEMKTLSAKDAIAALNPHVFVRLHETRVMADNVEELIKPYRLVIDGTDNIETRYILNRACVARSTTLISAALTQWEGQISLFKPWEGGPCYECLYPEPPREGQAVSCAAGGVLGPLTGVMGSLIAVETIKDVALAGRTLKDRVLIYNALDGETRTFDVEKRRDCPACG
ncbi:HesA/MoeB/ThiF family protein [Pikeienuella piscinae]|uniref:Molybdopterin-synthase adenylyltransferase n=1 Tax=Pikeienuella piscinae TaxID=2748098 RepID=A0A7L5C3J0_9RHOB|nr:HesA/MoeB/ThiF family protein [Pikeienuella piscinae]QIE56419.1 HesA/MoeB/ThiF family protein [Pikeienuella piscinae]